MNGRLGQRYGAAAGVAAPSPSDPSLGSRAHASGSKTSAGSRNSGSLSHAYAMGKSASLSALGAVKWAVGDEEFARLSQKDVEALKMVSSTKARSIIRHFSYSGMPREIDSGARAAKRAPPKTAAAATSEDPLTLEHALAPGSEAAYKRSVLCRRKLLMLEDLASAMCSDRTSANFVDAVSLNRDLDAECSDNQGDNDSICDGRHSQSVTRCASAASRREDGLLRAASSGGFGDAPPGAMPACIPSSCGLPLANSAGLSLERDHAALRKRRWPSMAKFERHYDVPEERLPPPAPTLEEEPRPLPMARATVADMEDSTSFGAQAYMWPALYQARELKEHNPSGQRPQSGTPANMFEAGVIYRQACAQLGINAMSPRPVFGERVEIRSNGIAGTQECFAIAEAVRACAARELILDACMTDMGVSRIVESAMKAGRLQSLVLAGSCLSHRTCMTLYTSLCTRVGTSLSELSLAQCGLGGNLEEELHELPDATAAAFAHGRKSIDDCAESLDARKRSIAEALEGDDDDDFSLRLSTTQIVDPEAGPSSVANDDGELGDGNTIRFSTSEGGARNTARRASEVFALKDNGDRLVSDSGGPVSGSPEAANEFDQTSSAMPIQTPMLLPLLGLFAQPTNALRRLDLSKTVLSLATTTCLAKALPTSPIEVLNLSRCSLSDEALAVIAEGVSFNRSLLELLLRGNKLSGKPGAVNALLDVAGRHVRIAHLDLAENELPKECITELCSAFCWSCSLVAVHILGAGIRGSVASEIAVACRKWTIDHATDETLRATSVAAPRKKKAHKDASGGEQEVVVCRALHVRGSSSWRVVSPVQRRAAVARSPILQAQESVAAPTPVPQSWMPACCWICCKAAVVEYRWVVPDKGAGEDSGVNGARVFVRPSFASFSRIELTRQRVVGAKRIQYNGLLLVPPGLHCHIFEAEIGDTTKLMHSTGEPSAELTDARLNPQQLEQLEALFRSNLYNGRVNLLGRITDHGFQISEHLNEEEPAVEADPWADDPLRQRHLQQAYEADLLSWHLSDLCDAYEEEEVKQTLWNVYGRLYDAYAIVAGRSQWPLVRQVDVYGFFEEAGLLDREGHARRDVQPQTASPPVSVPGSPSAGVASAAASPLAEAAGSSASPAPLFFASCTSQHPLSLQDVQQMLVQTIAQRSGPPRSAGGANGRRGSLAKRAASIQQRTQEGAPLNRPQFIEVMVRAALEIRDWDTSTSAGIQKFADEILSKRVLVPPLSPFPRGLLLQVGEVRDTLLARRSNIREAWERFGGNEQAFQRLSKLLKLCDRSFTAKHVASIFALSKHPQTDVKSLNKLGSALAYNEFCEAIGRLALIWERSSKPGSSSAAARVWPPQPRVGCPVRQRAIASRLGAFLENLSRRMRPTVRIIPF